MALGWATDDILPLRQLTAADTCSPHDITRPQISHTRYYNPDLHLGAFALPTYIAEYVEAAQ